MGKQDRAARIVGVEHLLYQNRQTGLRIEDIARICGVSGRTTRRDLKNLEQEVHIPLWQNGNRWGVDPDTYLPPIRLTLPEALNIFLASRLMLNYAHRNDPSITSIFVKLNSIVPPPLRDEIQKTMDWMQKLPKNDDYLRILATLAESWIARRQSKILYKSLEAKKAKERRIEPYFIEPAAPGHSSYVIAYCHRTKYLRTFKVERIETAELTSDPYTIPPDFDANEFLGSSWGIVVEGEVKTIRLKFIQEVAQIIGESIWHPTQVLKKQGDGSMIMTLQVTDTVDLYRWILNWGEKVEVLEPAELRKDIINTAKAMLDLYRE